MQTMALSLSFTQQCLDVMVCSRIVTRMSCKRCFTNQRICICERLEQVADTQGKSQTCYTGAILCYGIVSHGTQIGVLGLLPTTRARQTHSKCVHNHHAPCNVLRVFILMLRPQQMQVTNVSDEPQSKKGANRRIFLVYLQNK